jgi:pyruvate/2-oxoglutarate dehydrogenase complex dihydrolipoamide dehydrogenase (E3) component
VSKYQYDMIVIGGGSGGLVAARVASVLGARTALIDKERLGGDCLHYGCVPSKSLIHAAKIIKTAREAAALSVSGAEVKLEIDMAKVTQRIQGIIERIGQAEQSYVTNVDVKFGHAQFQSAHELKLDDQLLTSKSFIVATGSHPEVPAIEGLQEIGYLTNQSVFDLLHLPPSLVIVGGGPIGVELAQAFARLGSQVTLLQGRDRILPKEEPLVSQTVAEILTRDGVKFEYNVRLHKVRKEGDQKVVIVKRDQQELEFQADEILLALGRTPNTGDLNLEAAGIRYDEKGIKTNEYLQTTADNIYAIGDVIGGYLFTHIAAYQGGLAVRNALIPIGGRKKTDYRVVPWVTFTDPEVSRVGLTEAQAMKQHGRVRVIEFPWKDIDRAQTEGATEGFIKLVLDSKGEEIYGAHLVGAHSGEMLAELALAMQHKLSLKAILDTIHAYPTMSTGLQNAAFEVYLASSELRTSKQLLQPVIAFRG